VNITGLWYGHISGTNHGLITAKFKQEGEEFTAEAVLNDFQLGKAIIHLEGTIQDTKLKGKMSYYQGQAGFSPHTTDIEGTIDAEGTHISGKWRTDIMTGGILSLNKLSASAELPVELVFVQAKIENASVLSKTAIYDTRNRVIDPFCLEMGSLNELNNIFIDAAKAAKEIEEQTLKRILPIQNQATQLANIPNPFIEIRGADGEFIIVTDLTDFSTSVIPLNLKSINFGSYRQGGYSPGNGVQINIININGSDINNPQGNIYVYGSDKRWVEATFGAIRSFFEKRRTKRLWLHKTTTNQLVLFFLIIPTTFWIMFRIDHFIPENLKDIKLLGDTRIFATAIFLYVLALCYYGFYRLLKYFRLTFPLYEIRFPTNHWRQKHRIVAWIIFLGTVGSIIADIIIQLVR
jgi:hypothetical protein